MNFFKRWKQGIKDATPYQQLQAKKAGNLGGSIGLSMAFLTLTYRVIFVKLDFMQLGFAIFVFFMTWLQFLQYIKTKQQIDNIDKMEKLTGDNDGMGL